MTEYQRPRNGHDCEPTDNPADQPPVPKEGKDCAEPSPEPPEPPTLKEPKPCPGPDPECGCKDRPVSTSNCLEGLIANQTAEIAAAEKAKAFKADLEALLTKAKAANQDYTRDKYDKLRKQWKEQDADIAALVRKLVCAVTCWKCILDCHICPFLNDMDEAEQLLYGDGAWASDAHNLQDILNWRMQDRDANERRFNRIKNVLAAWEKPAQTIDKALTENGKLIGEIGKSLGAAEAPKAVYDMFFRLIPLHLAIAPPREKSGEWTTRIDKEYTKLCGCDEDRRFCGCNKGEPETCCGPDVGPLSLRQRLIGPQPYLIEPTDYFKLICCVVDKRYRPAKEALAKAEAAVVTADNEIKRRRAQVENGLKSFEKDAKAVIPSPLDCCDYRKSEPEPAPSRTR
jgi:hypothetical protein